MATPESLYIAASIDDAVAALAERGPAGAPLAGATWIMRAPLRHETALPAYVAISRIDALRRIDITDTDIRIGSCVTHARLADALSSLPEFHGLATAAGTSANPAIRQMATVGGNLCASGFPASDLVPALLCLDATIDLQSPAGTQSLSIADFLAQRDALAPGTLLCRVTLPRRGLRTAHARLPLRKAGDYPVAIASLAIGRTAAGIVESAAIAVGSVETVARRWTALETALLGQPLDASAIAGQAKAHAGAFVGRDGVEAPGWYRLQVLPTLVRRAVEALGEQP